MPLVVCYHKGYDVVSRDTEGKIGKGGYPEVQLALCQVALEARLCLIGNKGRRTEKNNLFARVFFLISLVFVTSLSRHHFGLPFWATTKPLHV